MDRWNKVLNWIELIIASHRIASHRIESNRIESNRIESNRIESNRIESNRIESNRIESNQIAIYEAHAATHVLRSQIRWPFSLKVTMATRVPLSLICTFPTTSRMNCFMLSQLSQVSLPPTLPQMLPDPSTTKPTSSTHSEKKKKLFTKKKMFLIFIFFIFFSLLIFLIIICNYFNYCPLIIFEWPVYVIFLQRSNGTLTVCTKLFRVKARLTYIFSNLMTGNGNLLQWFDYIFQHVQCNNRRESDVKEVCANCIKCRAAMFNLRPAGHIRPAKLFIRLASR